LGVEVRNVNDGLSLCVCACVYVCVCVWERERVKNVSIHYAWIGIWSKLKMIVTCVSAAQSQW